MTILGPILGPILGRPWLRRRNARLLRDAGRAINETGYVSAGGIDHFVTIRGASHDNPVLVFLHGGPGATQTVFATQTLSWEEHVTVVQYDQRGSGKTRNATGQPLTASSASNGSGGTPSTSSTRCGTSSA